MNIYVRLNVTGDDDYSSGSSGSLDQNVVKPDVYNAGIYMSSRISIIGLEV